MAHDLCVAGSRSSVLVPRFDPSKSPFKVLFPLVNELESVRPKLRDVAEELRPGAAFVMLANADREIFAYLNHDLVWTTPDGHLLLSIVGSLFQTHGAEAYDNYINQITDAGISIPKFDSWPSLEGWLCTDAGVERRNTPSANASASPLSALDPASSSTDVVHGKVLPRLVGPVKDDFPNVLADPCVLGSSRAASLAAVEDVDDTPLAPPLPSRNALTPSLSLSSHFIRHTSPVPENTRTSETAPSRKRGRVDSNEVLLRAPPAKRARASANDSASPSVAQQVSEAMDSRPESGSSTPTPSKKRKGKKRETVPVTRRRIIPGDAKAATTPSSPATQASTTSFSSRPAGAGTMYGAVRLPPSLNMDQPLEEVRNLDSTLRELLPQPRTFSDPQRYVLLEMVEPLSSSALISPPFSGRTASRTLLRMLSDASFVLPGPQRFGICSWEIGAPQTNVMLDRLRANAVAFRIERTRETFQRYQVDWSRWQNHLARILAQAKLQNPSLANQLAPRFLLERAMRLADSLPGPLDVVLSAPSGSEPPASGDAGLAVLLADATIAFVVFVTILLFDAKFYAPAQVVHREERGFLLKCVVGLARQP
ncbi:hypothetical protein FA13DRAFT_1716740 [Coprinellus micaceus]|uniref:Uncharacterized protein n=1 Tax=Coprinellus micaceus TaxID=71717 RepID=A0A4Y7SI47_COPMI|nr:hypothetical protein FA13DRAFT_1716740 [Coprinellus micaceus]